MFVSDALVRSFRTVISLLAAQKQAMAVPPFRYDPAAQIPSSRTMKYRASPAYVSKSVRAIPPDGGNPAEGDWQGNVIFNNMVPMTDGPRLSAQGPQLQV